MNELTVTTRQNTDATVITVSGEIDLASCPALERVIHLTPADGAPLRLDMSEVTFMDSSGLNLLLRLHRRLQGEGSPLVLTGLQDRVLRVLELTGANAVLLPDEPEAPLPRPRSAPPA
ncbi:STAS domain-containing protein [Streptomyces sp. NPDC013457]|uniref:STAS domain-containing protein n=1 Tax=Streptomyces sp. NPDC013457 TaxID=3364866 RepID=UPI0036F883D6